MKELLIEVDTQVYPLEVIEHTCLLFSESASASLKANKKKVCVRFQFGKKMSADKIKEIESKFWNELLHQALRLKIAKSNKKIREDIIRQALCGAFPRAASQDMKSEPVLESDIDKELEDILKEVEAENYQDDPLGIAIPWEEKYGKKEEKENAKF